MKFPPQLLASLIVCLLTGECISAEPATWQARLVEFDPIAGTELVRVPLDSMVYNQLQNDQRDLRIWDDQNREVAFVLRRRSVERTTERSWIVANAKVQPAAEDGLVIRFELNRHDPIPHRLNIVTPLFDFEQGIKLFGTVDGSEVELVSDVVFDYRRYMDVRRTELQIPPTTARQFRLVIASPTTLEESVLMEFTRQLRDGQEAGREERLQVERRPFRIERIELWGHETRQSRGAPALVPYTVAIESVTQDPERKRTILEVSSQREPLSRFQFETRDRNFSRRVWLTVPKADREEQLASAQLRWFDIGTIQEKQLTLDFPRQQELRYHIAIENQDSPPLEITAITAEGEVDDVYFLAESGVAYRLVYGNPTVAAPLYDTAAISASLQKSVDARAATLGPPQVAEFTPPSQPLRLQDLWNNPLIVGPVVLVLLAVFGWLLYRAASQVDAVE